VQGARRSGQQASYIAAHHAEIVRERRPLAEAAVGGLHAAIAALVDAEAAWNAEREAQADYVRAVPHLDGRDVPELGPLHQLIRDIRRVEVPSPLPRSGPQAAQQAAAIPAGPTALV
jgi:hypothetical protein